MAQNLPDRPKSSGWQCHPATGVFRPLADTSGKGRMFKSPISMAYRQRCSYWASGANIQNSVEMFRCKEWALFKWLLHGNVLFFFAKRTPWTFGADCLLCLQGAIHTLLLFPIPILSFKTSFFLDWKWANWYISNIIRVQICSFNSIFSIHCGDRWCVGGGWAHYGTELLPGLYGQPALWYSMGGGRGSWAWG